MCDTRHFAYAARYVITQGLCTRVEFQVDANGNGGDIKRSIETVAEQLIQCATSQFDNTFNANLTLRQSLDYI